MYIDKRPCPSIKATELLAGIEGQRMTVNSNIQSRYLIIFYIKVVTDRLRMNQFSTKGFDCFQQNLERKLIHKQK